MLDVKTCVRASFVSLSPPIGSQHKLIACHSLQGCSKLALGNKCEVHLLFQTMSVCKFNLLGTTVSRHFLGGRDFVKVAQ